MKRLIVFALLLLTIACVPLRQDIYASEIEVKRRLLWELNIVAREKLLRTLEVHLADREGFIKISWAKDGMLLSISVLYPSPSGSVGRVINHIVSNEDIDSTEFSLSLPSSRAIEMTPKDILHLKWRIENARAVPGLLRGIYI